MEKFVLLKFFDLNDTNTEYWEIEQRDKLRIINIIKKVNIRYVLQIK